MVLESEAVVNFSIPCNEILRVHYAALRDYTNYIHEKPGSFQPDIFKMLQNEAKSIPESRRYVMLLLNEMKIKEDIVYNKHTGDMVGFVNFGDINNTILDLQREMSGESHPPIAMLV